MRGGGGGVFGPNLQKVSQGSGQNVNKKLNLHFL
jgi:hypothetical protein